MCKISVIVPVYNTEKYLNRCLDSILNQTFSDFEIILVNDGSKDSSLNICLAYKKTDSRIKIIDKENGGLSSARNAGLDIAQGEYIAFVDSDDYISPRMFEDMYNALSNTHSDIAITKYKEVRDSNAKTKPAKNIVSYKGEEATAYYLEQRVESVCTNIYAKEAIGDTRFVLGKTSEDIKFHLDLFKKKLNIVTLDGEYYFYYNNPESISNGKMTKTKMSYIEFKEEQLDYYKTIGNKRFIEAAELLCARTYNGLLIRASLYGVDESLNEEQFFKETVGKLKKYKKLLLKSKQVPISRKILATIICFNYKILKTFRGLK